MLLHRWMIPRQHSARSILTRSILVHPSILPFRMRMEHSPLLLPPPLPLRNHSTSTNSMSMDVLKDLRNRTGAPIVDCKKAIQEAQKSLSSSDSTNSDTDLYQTALDWLRSHGAAKASTKVAGRETTQGLVALQIASPQATTAALVKVAAETDFAALSTTFVQLIQTIVQTVLHQPPSPPTPDAAPTTPDAAAANQTMEAILQLPAVVTTDSETSSNTTIQDCLNDAIVSIRENISITNAIHFPKVSTSEPASTGIYVGYVHNKVDTTTSGLDVNAGTAAAIVLLVPQTPATKQLSLEEYQHIGKLLAMHIVAAKPQYLSTTDVPAAIYDQERTLLQQQLQNDPATAQKPAPIVEQIIRGKLQKYIETIVLLEQPHMIVPDHPKIAQYLQEHELTLQRYEYLTI